MRGAKPRVPTETLIADFEAGLNSVQIAERHGMDADAVRARLHKWSPNCLSKRRGSDVQPESQESGEPIAAPGPTMVCADDGKIYSVNVLWLRDWACLSFSGGLIELLVAIDGGFCTQTFVPRGTARRVVNQRQVPISVGEPLVGTRVFNDRSGVKRTWKAYEAKPKATVKGFPRRLIPRDQEPADEPNGTLLYQCGTHSRSLRRARNLRQPTIGESRLAKQASVESTIHSEAG